MTVDSFWISVDTFLPRKNDRVLVVCTNPQNHMQRYVSVGTYFGDDNFTHKPVWSGHKNVTHWATLPELPPEGEYRKITIDELIKIISGK